MGLVPDHKAALSQADPAVVDGAFGRIAHFFPSGQWVPGGNAYAGDCVAVIDTHYHAGRAYAHAVSDLEEYVAASVPLHCADGWSYLGRALAAHMSGDGAAAVHLAYYAELRAAMSLLATQGIGIFGSTHIVLTGGGTALPIRGRNDQLPNGRPLSTHVFTWEALQEWATTKRAADSVLSAISPQGKMLSEWLDGFNAGTAAQQTVATVWLREWGLDLSTFADDRDLRNLVSYRPTGIHWNASSGARVALSFVHALWQLIGGDDARAFSQLDGLLLRRSLKWAFDSFIWPTATGAGTGTSEAAAYAGQVKRAIASLQFSDVDARRLLSFLTGSRPQDVVLGMSGKGFSQAVPGRYRGVMARAMLLLRLATGMCRMTLHSARAYTLDPTDWDALRFWWDRLGEDRGLWEPLCSPPQMADLWEPIDLACAELCNWHDDTGGKGTSYAGGMTHVPLALATMTQCERAMFWGLSQ